MEWSKIKTIIILILLMANLFLVGLAIARASAQSTSDREIRAEIIAIYKKSGITIGADMIPQNRALKIIWLERDQQQEQKMASVLGETVYTDLGGGIYSYHGESGSALFRSNGEFEITAETSISSVKPQNYKKHALDLCKKMGFDTDEDKADFAEDGDFFSLTSGQSIDGFPVFNCTITITYKNGSLISISGRRMTSQTVSSEEAELVNTETALIRFLNYLNHKGDVCNRIIDMAPGYNAMTSATDPLKLMPVWKITTDTGIYYIDSGNGNAREAA